MADTRDDRRFAEEHLGEIRSDIESTRQALGEKVDALESRAREMLDLRHQMQVHPMALLGASTGVGFVIGTLTAGPSSPRESAMAVPQPAQLSGVQPGREHASGRDSELFSKLKLAALSLFSGYARRALREYSPHWADELDRVWDEQGLEQVLGRRPVERAARLHRPGPSPESIGPRDVH